MTPEKSIRGYCEEETVAMRWLTLLLLLPACLAHLNVYLSSAEVWRLLGKFQNYAMTLLNLRNVKFLVNLIRCAVMIRVIRRDCFVADVPCF